MKINTIALGGKLFSKFSNALNLGSGSTWPGHIALKFHKNFIKDLLKNAPTKIILVVGTNGKTTTTKILSTFFEENDYNVFENTSGANLVNGIASSLLLHTNKLGQLTSDYAIFEVDENNLSLVLEEITPTAIIALNLFRDQLDRYGELDSIAHKWASAFLKLPSSTHLILNADDPLIAYLGISLSSRTNEAKARSLANKVRTSTVRDPKRQEHEISRFARNDKPNVMYFGLNDGEKNTLSHAADTTYCPNCNNKLEFTKITYSHLGDWHCPQCKLTRPNPSITEAYFPLDGVYNKYNTLAAVTTAQALGLDNKQIDTALHTVTPAFGRQEKLSYKGKNIQIFLSKNPTGFNESLRTIKDMDAKHVMLLLNDRIPDGRDVSWIWDIDIEQYVDKFDSITISGDRTYDMALRVEYAQKSQTPIPNYSTQPNLQDALKLALEHTSSSQTLYILPTYSAMLDVRKILTGRKIL